MIYVETKEATYRARLFIHGGRMHENTKRIEPIPGEWHPRFRNHPWVRMSNDEGWDVELRGHICHVITGRIMNHADYGDINSLMPDGEWVKVTRDRAEIYRKAKAWRDSVCAEFGSMEEYWNRTKHIPRVSEFHAPSTMPAPARVEIDGNLASMIGNIFKRVGPSIEEQDGSLTDRSRAMMGDTDQ